MEGIDIGEPPKDTFVGDKNEEDLNTFYVRQNDMNEEEEKIQSLEEKKVQSRVRNLRRIIPT